MVTHPPHLPHRFKEKNSCWLKPAWTAADIKDEQWIHTCRMLHRLPTMSITFGESSEMNNRAMLWGPFFLFWSLSLRLQHNEGEYCRTFAFVKTKPDAWGEHSAIRFCRLLNFSHSATITGLLDSLLFASLSLRSVTMKILAAHTESESEGACVVIGFASGGKCVSRLGARHRRWYENAFFRSLWKLPAAAAFLIEVNDPRAVRTITEKSGRRVCPPHTIGCLPRTTWSASHE